MSQAAAGLIDPARLRQLYEVDGYSIRAIADLLGASTGTIHSAIKRHKISRRIRPLSGRWQAPYDEIPRRTAPELWRVKLPYLDGRCEAVGSSDGRELSHPDDARCRFAATHQRDDYAVCAVHVRLEVTIRGHHPSAVSFRQGLETSAAQPIYKRPLPDF